MQCKFLCTTNKLEVQFSPNDLDCDVSYLQEIFDIRDEDVYLEEIEREHDFC